MSAAALSVASAELRGFEQALAARGEEWAHRFVGEYYRALADIAVGHEAEIEPPTAERILLVFRPNGAGAAPLRAVRWALDAQRGVLGLRNRRLLAGEEEVTAVCIALAVASGRGGSDLATVRERAVVLCARSGSGQIHIDAPTHDLIVRIAHGLRLSPIPAGDAAAPVFRCERRRAALREV
jgi:hypothetical protein